MTDIAGQDVSGDVAYEKPAEAHLTINAGRIVKFEVL